MNAPKRIARHFRSIRLHFARATWLLLVLLSIGGAGVYAQSETRSVVLIRTLLPSEWGVSHPVGIAYSDDSNQLYLVDRQDNNGLPFGGETEIVTITPFEDLIGSVNLNVVTADPINIAYDDIGERLFLFDVDRAALAQVRMDAQNAIDPTTLSSVDATRLNIVDAQGLAVDAARERLFILHGAAAQIIHFAIDAEMGFQDASIDAIDLTHLNASSLRGIAVHPANHHLYVADPIESLLHELTTGGRHVASYNLTNLALDNVGGMVFGRSADLTDPPETMHLFVADAGPVNRQNSRAGVLENRSNEALYLPLHWGVRGIGALSTAANVDGQVTSAQVNGKVLEVALETVACSCAAPGTTIAPAPTPLPPTIDLSPQAAYAFSVRVTNGNDDAEERASGRPSVRVDSTDLELIEEGTNAQLVGIRFVGVRVPDEATIVDAYIVFTVDEPDIRPTTLVFHGEAADNAARFAAIDGNISSRDLTSNRVEWTNVKPWTEIHRKHRTPNLAPIVREIMGRSGWQSGHALAFIISGFGGRIAESYNGSPDLAPRLYIEYELPDPG